jgi:lipopolysaccharide assembly outer membrane protein LptD (OstA)
MVLITVITTSNGFSQSNEELGKINFIPSPNPDRLQSDSLARIDSLNFINSPKIDTTLSKDAIEHKVEYDAIDSMKIDMATEKVYLYGSAQVNYEDIQLNADYIELDLKTNEVFASVVTDSADNKTGTPVFKDKGEEIEAVDLRYNFETKKGLISEAVTQQGDGYIIGTKVKIQPDKIIYIEDGKFCPCEDREAKTHIKAKKLKIIPDDKIVSGPANLRIGEIPTPLILPFSMFPNKKGASSGIVLPEYGFSPFQGIYLRNGGYFLPVNDNLDFLFTGDFYSRGSWGAAVGSNYKKPYLDIGIVD